MTDPHPIIPASDTAAIPSMLATALVYAERGWPVVPLHTVDPGGTCSCSSEKQCENPGKHPMTLHGYKDATRDPEEIKRWWTAHPTANIGIPTGAISGFDVLDVDTRSDGDESLADLESKLGRIPDTVESLTGGGGRHIFFQHHPGLRNMTAARMGIDIRAGGGYIVVPPSRHAVRTAVSLGAIEPA